MKRIIILSFFVLVGCTNMDQKLTKMESKHPIIDVLNVYSENANSKTRCTKLNDDSISLNPSRYYSTVASKICFFNYQKYLPKNTDIKTQDDFIALLKKASLPICANSSDKENCLQRKEQELNKYINGGLAQQKVEQEKRKKEEELSRKKREEEENRKKAEAKKREKEKKLEQIADCEQAFNTAYQNIPPEDFLMPSCKTDCCPGVVMIKEKKFEREYHLTVSGFAKDGVFLNNNSYFIYTDDTDYYTGETFRNSECVFYTRAGNYRYTTVSGTQRAVPAYKASHYKMEKAFYKNLQKDKTYVCAIAVIANDSGTRLEIAVMEEDNKHFFTRTKRYLDIGGVIYDSYLRRVHAEKPDGDL